MTDNLTEHMAALQSASKAFTESPDHLGSLLMSALALAWWLL